MSLNAVHLQSIATSEILLNEIISGQDDSLKWLAELCDDFGPRKTGSISLEKAIDWVMESLRASGFKVHSEPVPGLPNWIRGDDTAYITEPRQHKLNILAIDGSPPGLVDGEVIVIRDKEELQNKTVEGKIVVTAQNWTDYPNAVKYRRLAKEVAKRGGLALLAKSAAPMSLYTAHTGAGARGSPIPAACLTSEEAEMISRWYDRKKKVRVRLNMTSAESPEKVISRNVVFEIKGSTHPDEIVLLSAHIDSWDVGQGALDDGGGMAAVRAAMLAIKRLSEVNPDFQPERTIRAVFWTAEEQGTLGSSHYFHKHSNTSERFVFASECDLGAFRPCDYRARLRYQGDRRHKLLIEQMVLLMNANGIPLRVQNHKDQIDVTVFANAGIPTVNYESDKGSDYYFNFHHSNADYVSIFKEDDIKYTAAIFAVLAHNIANMEEW
ncbi:hypothetical protein V3C99_013387 [Haemonchus contortus]